MVMTYLLYYGIKQMVIVAGVTLLTLLIWLGSKVKTVPVRTGSTEEVGLSEKITRLLRAHLT